MKFVICSLILIFLIGLPLSTLNHNYNVFRTYVIGMDSEGVIVNKSEGGFSSRVNYYVYVLRNDEEIEIRIPYNVSNEKKIGDVIKYKYLEERDFGVYVGGLHPFNFIFNIIILILGFVFLFYTLFKGKSQVPTSP